MPVFIALGRLTAQGLQNLEHLAGRHQEAVRRAREMGGRVISSYATMGRYDFVVTLDCPDMETALRILNREAAGGNIRYETMSAIATRDFAEIFLNEEQREQEHQVLRLKRPRAGNAGKAGRARGAAAKWAKPGSKTPPK